MEVLMGKGPNERAARESSRKAKISDRVRGGESGGPSSEPSDPCLETRQIQIERDGAPVAVGDAIWLIAGRPPHAASTRGVIGPVRGPEAKPIEACIGVGVTFTGVVETVSASRATAVVKGR
jgi:hypothetical protein